MAALMRVLLWAFAATFIGVSATTSTSTCFDCEYMSNGTEAGSKGEMECDEPMSNATTADNCLFCTIVDFSGGDNVEGVNRKCIKADDGNLDQLVMLVGAMNTTDLFCLESSKLTDIKTVISGLNAEGLTVEKVCACTGDKCSPATALQPTLTVTALGLLALIISTAK